MRIGEVARLAGVKVPTIRYYEQIGLIMAPPRSASQRRRYEARDVRRLTFIRHARELGFEIESIRRLLALQDRPERPCGEIDALAREHLTTIDQKIAGLLALRKELDRILSSCAGGLVADCRVMEALNSRPAGSGAS
jgi:DNA-binding transcriptional MerR regulator